MEEHGLPLVERAEQRAAVGDLSDEIATLLTDLAARVRELTPGPPARPPLVPWWARHTATKFCAAEWRWHIDGFNCVVDYRGEAVPVVHSANGDPNDEFPAEPENRPDGVPEGAAFTPSTVAFSAVWRWRDEATGKAYAAHRKPIGGEVEGPFQLDYEASTEAYPAVRCSPHAAPADIPSGTRVRSGARHGTVTSPAIAWRSDEDPPAVLVLWDDARRDSMPVSVETSLLDVVEP